MSKKDYREKIEEHRQTIEMEEQHNSRMSRTRRHNGKQKTSRFSFMKFLTFIMIGIPLMILVYVSFFYTPNEKEVAEVDSESVVELQTNHTASASENTEEDQVNSEKDDESESNNQQENTEVVANVDQQSTGVEEQNNEKENQQASKETGTVHTVQANENLFRIAMKYYNDPNGVQKIMAANNLASDSISVGQSLIIP